MTNRPAILRHALKTTLISTNILGLWLGLQAVDIGQETSDVTHAYDLQSLRQYIWRSTLPFDDDGTSSTCNHQNLYDSKVAAPFRPKSAWAQGDESRGIELCWHMVGVGAIGLLAFILLIEVLRGRLVQAHLLQENEKRSHDLAHLGADLFWELDKELRFSYLSGNLQYLQRQDLEGKTPYQALSSLPNLEADWDYCRERLIRHQPLHNFAIRLHTSSTTLRIFHLNAHPLFDKNKRFQGYRGLQREVTEEYNLTQTIAYQATYDSLTGLINRNEFDTRLRQAVKRVQDRGISSVLGYLDLDQFKIVNDTAGHLVGDQLLTELAQLLKQNIRSSDSLGRLGGDEFGLLLEGCSLEQGQTLSQGLVDKVQSYQFTWRGRKFQVGVSIGLVPISGDASNVLELLSRADLACYKAKDLGRGRVYLADQNDTELDRQHLELIHIANIPQAIEENRFHLVEQPIISLVNEGHRHVEILLRLTDESGNNVAPNLFIPMAERYGMVGLIDRWVVRTVLTNYHHYYPAANTMVAINLSGSSLSDERFTEFVVQLLRQSTMPAERLCFEITETTTISQLDQALKFITTLKRLGVSFAIDDFGSGVSSFGYLRQLPVDYLKIDGELIRNMEAEKYICTIVDMVNQVAGMMGMQTIAEFVENDAILARLRSLNIAYAQGYGIAKPVPLPRIVK